MEKLKDIVNMDVTQDLSFIHLIQNASVLVQLVMGLLLLVSLMSWWFIFIKMFTVRQAVKQSEEFEESFWNNDDLNRLYQNTMRKQELKIDKFSCVNVP